MTAEVTDRLVVPEAERVARMIMVPFARKDPYSVYAQMREVAPIYRTDAGPWLVTSFNAISELLRSPDFGHGEGDDQLIRRHPKYATNAHVQAQANMIVFVDPPRHTAMRRLMAKAFSPSRVEALRGYVLDQTEILLGKLQDEESSSGSADFAKGFAERLPMSVMCHMLGVGHDDHAMLTRWAHDVTRGLEGTEEGDAAADTAVVGLSDYFEQLAERRRSAPTDDMYTDLLQAAEAERLTPKEAAAMAIALLVAGSETTTTLLSNAILALYLHPGERARLRNDPGLDGPAIDEILRYDPPLHTTHKRMALRDTELGGHRIGKGEVFICVIASGNRDLAAFPDADRLRIARPQESGVRMLSFGGGIHYCLGAALARLEGQIAVPEIVRRFPGYEVLDTNPERRGNIHVRGIHSLPICLEPK